MNERETIGYTVSSDQGAERFTVRAQAERYLGEVYRLKGYTSWHINNSLVNRALQNAYALWRENAPSGYEFGGVTVTFDGGDQTL